MAPMTALRAPRRPGTVPAPKGVWNEGGTILTKVVDDGVDRTAARAQRAEVADSLPRRAQADRIAQMQGRLIKAAIKCLHKVGYSQTTVSLVTQTAGVSRGALTHHYASKVELMVAVVEWVFEDDVRLYRKAAEARSFRAAFDDLSRTMWSILSRPAAIAVTEIMLAARSDPALAKSLRAKQMEIDKQARAKVRHSFEGAGMAMRPDGAAVHRVIVAAVRGLALEAMFMGPSDVEEPLRLLTQMHASLYPDLPQDPGSDPV
jgi:AcrR family transcriptional regulator